MGSWRFGLGGAAATGWTATVPAADVAQLPNGVVTFSATVTDAYGNVSLPAVHKVTVEGATPIVLSVASSPASGAFGLGKTIEITLHMNEDVVVQGSPTIVLNDCGLATYDKTLSSATSLTFDYLVGAQQNTSDLSTRGVELLCGASVADCDGDAANLAGANQALGFVIDTAPPEISRVTTSPTRGEVKTGQRVRGRGSRRSLPRYGRQGITAPAGGRRRVPSPIGRPQWRAPVSESR